MGCCASTRGRADSALSFPDAAMPVGLSPGLAKISPPASPARGRDRPRLAVDTHEVASEEHEAGDPKPGAACWDDEPTQVPQHSNKSMSAVSTPTSSSRRVWSPDSGRGSRTRLSSAQLPVAEEAVDDDGLCEIKLDTVPVSGPEVSPPRATAAPTGSLGTRHARNRSPAASPTHAFAAAGVGNHGDAAVPRWLRTPASDSDVLSARRRALVKRRSPGALSASAGELVSPAKFDVVRDPGVAVYVSDGSPRIVTLHSRMQYRMQHRSSSDSGVQRSSSRSRGSSCDLVDARQTSREWAPNAVPPGRLVSSGSNAGSTESPSPKPQGVGRRRRSLPRVQMLRADAVADRGPASSRSGAGGDDDLPATRRRSSSDTPPRMRRRKRGLFVDTTSEPRASPFTASGARVSPVSAPHVHGRPRSGSLGFQSVSDAANADVRHLSRASPGSPLSPLGRGRGRGSARGRGAGLLRRPGSGVHPVDPISRVMETRGRSTSAPEPMKPPAGLPALAKALRGRSASGKHSEPQRPSTVAGGARRRSTALTPTGIAARRMSLSQLFKRSHSADVTNFTPEPTQFPDPFANSPDEALRGVDEADQCVMPRLCPVITGPAIPTKLTTMACACAGLGVGRTCRQT